MNAEIKHASDLVISARKALSDNSEIKISATESLEVRFKFISKSFLRKSLLCNSVTDWYDMCLCRGLADIKLFLPINTNEKYLLGFANTSNCAVVCIWKNKKNTVFTPIWEYDKDRLVWTITYNEQPAKMNFTAYANTTSSLENFKTILLEIQKFAENLGDQYYADVFIKAYNALNNDNDDTTNSDQIQLPYHFKNIYHAIDTADVLGAMGSWNDTPYCIAQEKGLLNQYNKLSDELLIQLRSNMMYIVNECWKID